MHKRDRDAIQLEQLQKEHDVISSEGTKLDRFSQIFAILGVSFLRVVFVLMTLIAFGLSIYAFTIVTHGEYLKGTLDIASKLFIFFKVGLILCLISVITWMVAELSAQIKRKKITRKILYLRLKQQLKKDLKLK